MALMALDCNLTVRREVRTWPPSWLGSSIQPWMQGKGEREGELEVGMTRGVHPLVREGAGPACQ